MDFLFLLGFLSFPCTNPIFPRFWGFFLPQPPRTLGADLGWILREFYGILGGFSASLGISLFPLYQPCFWVFFAVFSPSAPWCPGGRFEVDWGNLGVDFVGISGDLGWIWGGFEGILRDLGWIFFLF